MSRAKLPVVKAGIDWAACLWAGVLGRRPGDLSHHAVEATRSRLRLGADMFCAGVCRAGRAPDAIDLVTHGTAFGGPCRDGAPFGAAHYYRPQWGGFWPRKSPPPRWVRMPREIDRWRGLGGAIEKHFAEIKCGARGASDERQGALCDLIAKFDTGAKTGGFGNSVIRP